MNGAPPTATAGAEPASPAGTAPSAPTPLFRRIDWLAFGIVTLLLLTVYALTRAPSLTCGEDCGEFCVAGMYAGVPHPRGFPVWTNLAWLWTKLVPFGNIAWRLALFSSLVSALACGLTALVVSRCSRSFLKSLEPFKELEGVHSNWISLVAGFVAGLVNGFNGFFWSQAVTVGVFPLSALGLSGMMVALMRWTYAPEQRRYLYLAWFLLGVCCNNQPSLAVTALPLQIVVTLIHPRLGRDLFLGNVILWVLAFVVLPLLRSFGMWEIPLFEIPSNFFELYSYPGAPLPAIYHCLVIGSMVVFVCLCVKTRQIISARPWALVCLAAFLAGMAFYLYMPIASMTNPPINWGYARTAQGFSHLIARGSYERIHPVVEPIRYAQQLWHILGRGALEEFGIICLFFALVPFFYLWRLRKAEQNWLVGVVALYVFLGPILLFLFNPLPSRQSLELVRFFFTPSHFILAMLIGFGVAFVAAQLWWRFHRRGLLGAGLLAALALLPAYPALTHWSKADQRGHLFGYWHGRDMFTAAPELCRGWDGQPLYPAMATNAVLFAGTFEGRFAAAYMIFCESFLPPEQRTDPEFDRRDVYLVHQDALADSTYLQSLRAHYFRSAQKDPPVFQELLRGWQERETNTTTNLCARMLTPLDRLFLSRGARIEREWRAGGLYPSVEISTPSNEDSQDVFQEYMKDAKERLEKGRLRANEEVRLVGGRVMVSGQVAVNAINGLLAKVIFDRNTNHEFYVEESFPIDWMYPHLTPFGLIMKLNRQPVRSITDDMMSRDHEFWCRYSQRLIGDWITYDTPVSNLCAFVERVHLRHDYSGFEGDRRFVRDMPAQQAFAKMRSALGGLYTWRLGPDCPAEHRPKPGLESQRLEREAEFAFKQAYAFCPCSPDALYRFANLLAHQWRLDEARLLAATARKLNPDDADLKKLVDQLAVMRKPQP
jgi:hypothetical protein